MKPKIILDTIGFTNGHWTRFTDGLIQTGVLMSALGLTAIVAGQMLSVNGQQWFWFDKMPEQIGIINEVYNVFDAHRKK